ncbi:properdin, partial [Vidua macroura]|uniref:properdin n=1 Tax=Vidua macroura TaxID=187451 RepID=UPI0023A880F2
AGGWSPWSPWGLCSVTCGGGGPSGATAAAPARPPSAGGSCGPGAGEDTRGCRGTTAACPVAGAWGPWGPWGPCSGSCRGSGAGAEPPPPLRFPGAIAGPPRSPLPRQRHPQRALPGAAALPRGRRVGGVVSGHALPGHVRPGRGRQRRACDAPSPKYGGRGCEGPESRRGVCGPRDPCPVPVHWGPWSPWSPCLRPWGDISCRKAVGQQRRTRECVGHSPGGAACPTAQGSSIELRACYSLQNCVMPGNWSDWSHWGLCTPPCGSSPTRSRSRECRPVLPDYPPTVPNVGSAGSSRVWFWGAARPLCTPLLGQRLRLEETRPCRNVRGCPSTRRKETLGDLVGPPRDPKPARIDPKTPPAPPPNKIPASKRLRRLWGRGEPEVGLT